MKKSIYFSSILFGSIIFLSWTPEKTDFHVTFEQNGKIIRPVNHKITLSKEEFSIVLEFSEPMGLLINASFDKKTYDLASQGNPKSDLPGFQSTGMAEDILNPDKEIFLSQEAPSYWFYDDVRENRFNEAKKVINKIICKRIIQNLHDVDNETNIKVEDVNDPLYLVFISSEYTDNLMDEIELKREWVKIKWKD